MSKNFNKQYNSDPDLVWQIHLKRIRELKFFFLPFKKIPHTKSDAKILIYYLNTCSLSHGTVTGVLNKNNIQCTQKDAKG